MKILNKDNFFNLYLKVKRYPPFQDRNGIFYYICFILFFWYANNPDVFERKFFVNEFFSLAGFFLFLSNPVIYKKNDYIYNIVVLILFIFSFYAVLSLFIFESFYGYLRNTVIVYSIFSFFLGIRLFDILLRIAKSDFLFLSAMFPSASFYRTSYAVLIPLYLFRYSKSFNIVSLLMTIAVMSGFAIYYGGQTAFIVISLLFLLHIMNNWIRITALASLAFIVIGFFVFIEPYFNMLLQSDWWSVVDKHYLFNIDGNLTMRFFYWSYIFYKDFIDNLLGIGLGTPLFSKHFLEWRLYLWHSIRPDPYIEYTMGAHNSYLTILARFGIIGIIPFLVLYWKLTADFVQCKFSLQNPKLHFFYYAFFIISGSAIVNVVIESPIHASLYWGLLGMLCQAKKEYAN